MITISHRFKKLLKPMTIRVGIGRVAPNSVNNVAKTGMTKTSKTPTTVTATLITMTG